MSTALHKNDTRPHFYGIPAYNPVNIMDHIPENIFTNMSQESKDLIVKVFKDIQNGVYKCSICGKKIRKVDSNKPLARKKSLIKIVSFLAISVLCICSFMSNNDTDKLIDKLQRMQGMEIPSTPIVIEPCILKPTIRDVEHSGYCTVEQISEAFQVYRNLVAENDKEVKAEAKRAAQEYYESMEKIRLDENKEYEEFKRKIENPTEEERQERQKKIDEQMDRKFNGWFGYTPRNSPGKTEHPECPIDAVNIDSYRGVHLPIILNNPNVNPYCKSHAQIILDVPQESNDTEIKRKYRALALEFHPDKYKGENSDNIFSIIRTSYETLTI